MMRNREIEREFQRIGREFSALFNGVFDWQFMQHKDKFYQWEYQELIRLLYRQEARGHTLAKFKAWRESKPEGMICAMNTTILKSPLKGTIKYFDLCFGALDWNPRQFTREA